MTRTVLGIIGGSGLYDIPSLKSVRWETVSSPWGEPSDQILFAEIDGLPLRFLPRHGRGHRLPPSAINFDAAERLFCTVTRQRTSTPLQALVLLNDPQYVEAARAIAERTMAEGGTTTRDRITLRKQVESRAAWSR